MPLTYAGEVDVEEPATRAAASGPARSSPEYTRGDLRRVATARQQPEAELIQMLLLEEGVPSTLRRSAGFDVPDILAAGPRDVLVPGVRAARSRARCCGRARSSTQAPTAPPGMSTAPGRPAAVLLLGPRCWGRRCWSS